MTTSNIVLRHTYALSPTWSIHCCLNARNNQPSVAPQNTTTPAEIGFTADFVANPQFAGPPLIQFLQRGVVLGNSIQGPTNPITMTSGSAGLLLELPSRVAPFCPGARRIEQRGKLLNRKRHMLHHE